MPNSAFNKMGFKKQMLLTYVASMAELLEDSISISKFCPVLIVLWREGQCKTKIKRILLIIWTINFHELMKTGHEANIEAPEELENRVAKILW